LPEIYNNKKIFWPELGEVENCGRFCNFWHILGICKWRENNGNILTWWLNRILAHWNHFQLNCILFGTFLK
jgi:hypothetical protein